SHFGTKHFTLLRRWRRDSHALASRYAIDCNRSRATSEIRESCVSRCDLKRRCFTRAECHRGICAWRFRESGLRGEIHHASDRYLHRDINSDDVETMDQTIAQSNRLMRVTLAKVSG